MCLTNGTFCGFSRNEDIKCYKVMLMFEDGALLTPYFNRRYEIGKTYEDEPDIEVTRENAPLQIKFPVEEAEIMHCEEPKYTVGRGFIHSFLSVWDAAVFMNRAPYPSWYMRFVDRNDLIGWVVVECSIPKDGIMFAGYWREQDTPVYASRSLSFTRILDWKEVFESIPEDMPRFVEENYAYKY